MRVPPLLLFAAVLTLRSLAAPPPDVVELSFDATFDKPDVLAESKQPAWLTAVEQRDGRFLDEPRCWQVAVSAPEGAGRLSITVDRERMKRDLVATILFEAGDGADFAVQLFDGQGRAVVVDLFGNLVDVGKEASTNTMIVPLRKYPTAEKIVLRRIKGDVRIYRIVLYPVITEGAPVAPALQALANVLGDPLSPANPLLASLKRIAQKGNVGISPVPPAAATSAASTPVTGKVYLAAEIPPKGGQAVPMPTDGLVAYWSFDQQPFGRDASGRGHAGRVKGGVEPVDGVHGRALRFHTAGKGNITIPASPDFELKETLTVSAWVKPTTLTGAQIVFFGDRQKGRDPWVLKMHSGGRLQLRSDRSVTGKPAFLVSDQEIVLLPSGEKMLSQHVAVNSPGTLAPDNWYFIAGTIERVSSRQSAFTLYVNGASVGRVQISETVNYPTDKMAVTLGAADRGDWLNFDGVIDEVLVYDRALSAAEITSLYR